MHRLNSISDMSLFVCVGDSYLSISILSLFIYFFFQLLTLAPAWKAELVNLGNI